MLHCGNRSWLASLRVNRNLIRAEVFLRTSLLRSNGASPKLLVKTASHENTIGSCHSSLSSVAPVMCQKPQSRHSCLFEISRGLRCYRSSDKPSQEEQGNPLRIFFSLYSKSSKWDRHRKVLKKKTTLAVNREYKARFHLSIGRPSVFSALWVLFTEIESILKHKRCASVPPVSSKHPFRRRQSMNILEALQLFVHFLPFLWVCCSEDHRWSINPVYWYCIYLFLQKLNAYWKKVWSLNLQPCLFLSSKVGNYWQITDAWLRIYGQTAAQIGSFVETIVLWWQRIFYSIHSCFHGRSTVLENPMCLLCRIMVMPLQTYTAVDHCKVGYILHYHSDFLILYVFLHCCRSATPSHFATWVDMREPL